MAAYPRLFAPLQLRSRELKNRVAGGATTSLYSAGGAVTQRLLDHYASRARGGAAMIVTESMAGSVLQPPGNRIWAFDESKLDGFKRWAEAVEPHDCRLLGQLGDPGRGSHHGVRNAHAVGASALPDDLSWTMPRAMTIAEIGQRVAHLAETAHRLQRAGFSGIELSCCHGHLFHQFLSPQANHRDDAYGGDLEGRSRFMREVYAAVRAACGGKFIVGIKLVGNDGVPGGVSPELSAQIAARIARDETVDYIAVAQGAHHRSLELHVPDRTYPPLPYRDIWRKVRDAAKGTPVFGVGRVTTPAEAEEVITAGDCDAVMMARPFLADAGWVKKAREGREQSMRLCVSCNSCWEQTTSHKPLACDVNPRIALADELDWQPPKAEYPRRIAIVGAGPAGLEAAWVAARRGHQVTLFGASAEVGGKTRLNARIPGCSQLARIYDYQLWAATDAGVAFRLGRMATADDVLAVNPEQVLLATGATMYRPETLGTGGAVQDLRTAIAGLLDTPGKRKGTAVLYDCDHTAGTYDGAEFLHANYEKLVIITPRDSLASDVALVTRQRTHRRLAERRIEIITLAEITGFSGHTLAYCKFYSGDIGQITDVSLVAYSTARVPNEALAASLRAKGVKVRLIGDCYSPRSVMAATQEGSLAGCEA